MSSRGLEYLLHILEETRYIMTSAKNLNISDFVENETMKRAFVRSLEVIGEATKKVPDDIKLKYPNIEWKAIAGMRDKLIHDYFGVDYEIVWDVVINKIPKLHDEISYILSEEKR